MSTDPTPAAPRACNAFNLEGERCGQTTVGPNGLCIWHDPDRVADAAEARRRGQERYREVQAEQRRRSAVKAEDLPPPFELTAAGLLRMLAWIHQQLAAERLDPDRARELRGTIREMRPFIRDRDIEDRLHTALAELKEHRRKQGIRRVM